MVQTNMGIRASDYIDYDIVDAVPREQKIKKQIEVDGTWETRQFIRIPVFGADHRARGNSELEKWCYKYYKEPRYLGPWFKIAGYIILDEKTYTHWKLCE
jgi:hypothetical protein